MLEPQQTPPAPPLERPILTSRRRGLWRDVAEMVILIVVVYTLVNLTTARAIVEGPSMQPNFYTGQLVIINRFAYYYASPARGDVVVLHNPGDSCKDVIKQDMGLSILVPHDTGEACADLIKRVIGLPGETVEVKGKNVFINGTQIDEPYIVNPCERNCEGKWTLGTDQYFVMGDNRPNSYDSRGFGPINRSLIVGEAWVRYWPVQDMSVIPHPSYGTIPTATAATPPATTEK